MGRFRSSECESGGRFVAVVMELCGCCPWQSGDCFDLFFGLCIQDCESKSSIALIAFGKASIDRDLGIFGSSRPNITQARARLAGYLA